MTHVTVDATNQTLGRLSSKVAFLLRGKNLPSFEPAVEPQVEVTIENAEKVKFSGSKFTKKIYYSYSGYHGGIKAKKLSDLWEEKPTHVIKECVYHMLPKNKTRDKIIKNLKFK